MLAQDVVNHWGIHSMAGHASSLTPEFLSVFEKACRYQQAKNVADFYRSRNMSEEIPQPEETARRTFIEAYEAWREKQNS